MNRSRSNSYSRQSSQGKDYGVSTRDIFCTHFTRENVERVLSGEGLWGPFFVRVLVLLVTLSTISCSLKTVSVLKQDFGPFFKGIEYFCVLSFTIEYLARLWVAPHFCYILQGIALLDLAAILPSWINFFIKGDVLPGFEFLRMLRLFKFLACSRRGSKAVNAFLMCWRHNSSLLMAASFVGCCIWLLVSALQYTVENGNLLMLHCYPLSIDVDLDEYPCQCPEDDIDACIDALNSPHFCHCDQRFSSIPSSMFFTLLNLSGKYPLAKRRTTVGRIITTITAILSVGVLSIPTGLLASALQRAVKELDSECSEDEDDNAIGRDTMQRQISSESAYTLLSEDESQADFDSADEAVHDSAVMADIAQQWNQRIAGKSHYYAIDGYFPKYTMTAWYRYTTLILINSSCCASILATVRSFPSSLGFLLVAVDLICMATFFVEHVARILAAGPKVTMQSMFAGILPFSDLVSWGPSLITFLACGGICMLRWPWLFLTISFFRLMKYERYSHGLWVLKSIISHSQGVLSIGGMATLCCLVFAAAIMYYCERHNPDPTMREHYASIPTAMWITLINLSGNTPLCDYTLGGRVVVSMLCLAAFAVFALPVAAVGAGFERILSEMKTLLEKMREEADRKQEDQTKTDAAKLLLEDNNPSIASSSNEIDEDSLMEKNFRVAPFDDSLMKSEIEMVGSPGNKLNRLFPKAEDTEPLLETSYEERQPLIGMINPLQPQRQVFQKSGKEMFADGKGSNHDSDESSGFHTVISSTPTPSYGATLLPDYDPEATAVMPLTPNGSNTRPSSERYNTRPSSLTNRFKRWVRQVVAADWFKDVSVQATIFAAAVEILSTCAFARSDEGLQFVNIAETAVVVWFTIEYCIRFAADGLSYSLSWLGVLDLIATLPWYIAQALGVNKAMGVFFNHYDGPLRALRLLRLVRLDMYAPSLSLIGKALRSCWDGISVSVYAFIVFWFLINEWLFLSEFADAENGQTRHFRSALSSMQFSAMVLTGNYPLSDLTISGQMASCFALVLSVCITAVPASVLASSFVDLLREETEARRAAKLRIALFLQRLWRAKNGIQTNMTIGMVIKMAKAKKERERRESLHPHTIKKKKTPPVLARICTWKNGKSSSAQAIRIFIMVLIALNVLIVLLQSMDSVENFVPGVYWSSFEIFSVALFTADYFLNVLLAGYDLNWNYSRRKMLFSGLGISDLLAILPFYLGNFLFPYLAPNMTFQPTVFRMFRILRLSRLIRLDAYIRAFEQIEIVFQKVAPVLRATGVVALVVWIGSASILYYSESSSGVPDPLAAARGGEEVYTFTSIVEALYYVATFLAGDWAMYDFTPIGCVLSVFIAIFGVAIFTIPVGLFFEGFQDVIHERQEQEKADRRRMREERREQRLSKKNSMRLPHQLSSNKSDSSDFSAKEGAKQSGLPAFPTTLPGQNSVSPPLLPSSAGNPTTEREMKCDEAAENTALNTPLASYGSVNGEHKKPVTRRDLPTVPPSLMSAPESEVNQWAATGYGAVQFVSPSSTRRKVPNSVEDEHGSFLYQQSQHSHSASSQLLTHAALRKLSQNDPPRVLMENSFRDEEKTNNTLAPESDVNSWAKKGYGAVQFVSRACSKKSQAAIASTADASNKKKETESYVQRAFRAAKEHSRSTTPISFGGNSEMQRNEMVTPKKGEEEHPLLLPISSDNGIPAFNMTMPVVPAPQPLSTNISMPIPFTPKSRVANAKAALDDSDTDDEDLHEPDIVEEDDDDAKDAAEEAMKRVRAETVSAITAPSPFDSPVAFVSKTGASEISPGEISPVPVTAEFDAAVVRPTIEEDLVLEDEVPELTVPLNNHPLDSTPPSSDNEKEDVAMPLLPSGFYRGGKWCPLPAEDDAPVIGEATASFPPVVSSDVGNDKDENTASENNSENRRGFYRGKEWQDLPPSPQKPGASVNTTASEHDADTASPDHLDASDGPIKSPTNASEELTDVKNIGEEQSDSNGKSNTRRGFYRGKEWQEMPPSPQKPGASASGSSSPIDMDNSQIEQPDSSEVLEPSPTTAVVASQQDGSPSSPAFHVNQLGRSMPRPSRSGQPPRISESPVAATKEDARPHHTESPVESMEVPLRKSAAPPRPRLWQPLAEGGKRRREEGNNMNNALAALDAALERSAKYRKSTPTSARSGGRTATAGREGDDINRLVTPNYPSTPQQRQLDRSQYHTPPSGESSKGSSVIENAGDFVTPRGRLGEWDSAGSSRRSSPRSRANVTGESASTGSFRTISPRSRAKEAKPSWR